MKKKHNDSKKLWLNVDKKMKNKNVTLGKYASQIYLDDPIALSFKTSRYKFCSKILISKKNILEVGCGDAFGSSIVAQFSESMTCTDINTPLLNDNKKRLKIKKNMHFQYHDFRDHSFPKNFDGCLMIDVIEHIFPKEQDKFMKNICSSLEADAICIIGTPNITSNKYASKYSKMAHVNMKNHKSLSVIGNKYFKNHLIFGMNDEVVHTGFYNMSHFLWLVGISPR